MQRFIRNYFVYFAAALLASALAWAVSFGTLPPADFTFDNNTEIKTIDPALATGQPEGRVLDAIGEGLLRKLPVRPTENSLPSEAVEITPQPAVAESFEVSDDRLTYTFHIRPTAKWSDGTPMTAEDFRFSWLRMLHPETPSEYAYELYYIVGSEDYNTAKVEVGGLVEVELADRPQRQQLFPRGTIVRGKLTEILKEEPVVKEEDTANKDTQGKKEETGAKEDSWVYVVEVSSVEPCSRLSQKDQGEITAKMPQTVRVSKKPNFKRSTPVADIREHLQILPDFNATVGLTAPDPNKLVVKLKNPTHYFPDLVSFYPLYPVNRRCIETFGVPNWAKPENVVLNGPFKMQFRRLRDRLRVVKNEHYWDAARVKCNVIDILAIKSETTGMNMYLNGQIDWLTTVSNSLIEPVKEKRGDEYFSSPMLAIYMYRLNTTRPPLDNKLVRQALARAIDRRQITEYVTKAGEVPAVSFVPPFLKDYHSPPGPQLDLDSARQLLDEAGFPGGRGLPGFEILFNANQTHQDIAEVVQHQWRGELGIDVELRPLEWGVFLDTLTKKQYDVARSGWIGDYPDPNTFLKMWVTDGANNQTGWSNKEYDSLVEQAASEADPEKRMKLFYRAEEILLDEVPIIPVYYQVAKNMVRPGVKGFTANAQDIHPLTELNVEPRTKGAR